MNPRSVTIPPGAYRFTAKSTAEAVTLIRERLGPTARVLSVRAVEARGWKRLFAAPHLEVIAQVDAAPAAALAPLPGRELPAGQDPSPDLPAGGGRSGPASRLGQVSASLGLSGLLRRAGVTEATLLRLQTGKNWDKINALPLHRALAETSRLLCGQTESRSVRPPLSRAAFIGGAGVGRTTALCKWLAADVFRRARVGHVVSVEFDRPNPLGPLTVFAEALGVALAHFPCATNPAVPGAFVYCDLPAISPRRPADNAAVAAWLDREQFTERVLVLNAAYDRASLRDAYIAGRDLGATHLVFTHLDEVPQWGKLWDYLFDEEIEPLFLATGPSLTDECEEDVSGAIVRRTLPDDAG